jgi:hypothetical protein
MIDAGADLYQIEQVPVVEDLHEDILEFFPDKLVLPTTMASLDHASRCMNRKEACQHSLQVLSLV